MSVNSPDGTVTPKHIARDSNPEKDDVLQYPHKRESLRWQ